MGIAAETAPFQLGLETHPVAIGHSFDDQIHILGVTDRLTGQVVGDQEPGCAATKECRALQQVLAERASDQIDHRPMLLRDVSHGNPNRDASLSRAIARSRGCPRRSASSTASMA